MGPIGVPEMIAIFVIALLLFGPKKLPELGRTLGKAITEFRRASNELKATFESHLSELDKENQSLKQTLSSFTDPDSSASYSYDNDYNSADQPLPVFWFFGIQRLSTNHSQRHRNTGRSGQPG